LNEWATYCPSTLPLRSNDQVPIPSTSRLMLSGDSPAFQWTNPHSRIRQQ
jgi:hypothetical protein